MTDVMYKVPSDRSIRRVVITEAAARGEGEPLIIRDENRPALEEFSKAE